MNNIEQLYELLKEVRNNANVEKLIILGSDEDVLNEIQQLSLPNVKIQYVNNRFVDMADKIYVLPDYSKKQFEIRGLDEYE